MPYSYAGCLPSNDLRDALNHIKDYERLARRLGPAFVGDSIDTLFALPGEDLDELFECYRCAFGWKAYNYAVETFPRWRSGQVKMSGQTAERFLNLIPQHVPEADQLALIQKLCRHHSTPRHESVEIDRNNPDSIRPQMHAAMVRIANASAVRGLPEPVTDTMYWLKSPEGRKRRALLADIERQDHQSAQERVEERWPTIATYVQEHKAQGSTDTFSFPSGSLRVFTRRMPAFLVFSTAVYRTLNHPDILVLRAWRDGPLRERWYSTPLAGLYRLLSPFGAVLLRIAPFLRPLARRALGGMARKARRVGA
ncbi:hypothetical protein [Thioalkalivibrio sp. ALE16]|uniref:hypothetical protein n=1 Tax=Thioalkalivibrio sp. ALE16 TaxID=1158172 RepID=UPI0004760C92|nr:hypothetical protein [Thioalkalivibrio sp. ALE16]